MSGEIPLREILLRLPAISLLRFRAVSKRWRAVIDDPCFVKAHININQSSSNSTTVIIRNSVGPPFYPLYYFDLAALNFTNGTQTIPVTPLSLAPSGLSHLQALPLAACNGLILIAPECRDINRGNVINWDPKGTWEITNPLTRERLTLPQLNFNSHVLGIGLGYDYVLDDYKVVVIDYELDDVSDKSLSQTHVYSLKLDSWRKIGNCPYNFWNRENRQDGGFLKSRNIQHGVFLKGALHWVSDDEIIVFDVGTENYHQLALPHLQKKPKSMQLDVLGGCLCLSYFIEEGNMERWGKLYRAHFDAWVMNDYGSQDSWIKLFKLRGCDVSYTYRYLRPVAYMKNKNGVLLHHDDGLFWFDDELFWFDVWSNCVKEVNIHGICRYSKYYSAQIFVGSLFRLHDSCGRAASKGRTRKREMKMQMADTKLTFCVRDFVTNDHSPPHDRCYSSLYRYNSPSEVRAASFIQDVDSTTLSLDVCREILLRLPAKSLLRFRTVCKAWCAVIDEPFFVRAHTNKLSSNTSNIIIRNSTGPPFHPLYSFDLYDLKFANGLQKISVSPLNFTPSGLSLLRASPVSACNGLILVSGKGWEIWNPLTHERLKLPLGKCNPNQKGEAIGLGYDYTTDDYKVVVIHGHRIHRRRHGHDNFARQTHVYSLRSDSWRNVENCPHDCYSPWWGPRGPGVFLCGALHWTMFNSPYGVDTIIAFDLGTENFRQLQAPPLRERDKLTVKNRYLNVLDGCLVVSDFGKANHIGDELEHYDVWVLKDYGDKDSWIKVLSFEDKECLFYSIGENLRPVAFMKDKTQILLQDYCSRFFMFDVESNSMKRVRIHGLTGTLYAQIVDRTIFRLHDNCGVNATVTTRRRRRIGKRRIDMKMSDTKLNFCVRDAKYYYHSGDSCYSLDSNWDHSSGEGED